MCKVFIYRKQLCVMSSVDLPLLSTSFVLRCSVLQRQQETSNLSKAYVTRDSSGPTTLAISVQHAIQ